MSYVASTSPNKNDSVQIFCSFLVVSTLAFILSSSLAYFICFLLLIALLYSTKAAVVPLSDAVKCMFVIYPFVMIFMLLPSLLYAWFMFKSNSKAHEPFQPRNGILPLYKIQRKELKLQLPYAEIYRLSLDSLESLSRPECVVKINDSDKGIIVANLNYKLKGKRGDTVQFKLKELPSGEVVVNLSSTSNALVKGMDSASNIKNIQDIVSYFQHNVPSVKMEVS